jgi:hypothetical protein
VSLATVRDNNLEEGGQSRAEQGRDNALVPGVNKRIRMRMAMTASQVKHQSARRPKLHACVTILMTSKHMRNLIISNRLAVALTQPPSLSVILNPNLRLPTKRRRSDLVNPCLVLSRLI